MKLATAPQDVILSDDFEQRDVAIGDVAFILDMFADKVYSNKERAVIRELACNAHDSHVMAGTTDVPFKVHLPTQLEPWFSIRDFGTGLEDDDIANIYGAIGVSTKRDSNDVIGCFGIGSLSPYSMCDSFTVKSYINGTVRTYQCMRDEQRKPKVIPLGSASTHESNGLEVKLTVQGRIDQFADEAENVFRFWEGTLPEINDMNVTRACKEQRDEYVFKGDDFGLTASWGRMVAIMGNIAYKIPSELDEFDTDGYLKFDMGELEFDTARENLSMTDKTKQALAAKFKSVKDKLKDVAIEQIEAKTTIFDKALLAETLSNGRIGRFIGNDKLREYFLPRASEKVVYWQAKYRGSERYATADVSASKSAEYYVHKDRMQTRIKEYLKDMSSGHTMYIFKDLAQAKECGIPDDKLSDLEDLPKVTRNYTGGTTSKCKTLLFKDRRWHHNHKESWEEHDLELDGSEIVYVEVSRFQPVSVWRYSSDNSQMQSTISKARQHGIDIKLVGLKTAFLKTKTFKDGNFIELETYLKREYAKKAPTTFYKYDGSDLSMLKSIHKYVDSQEINDIIKLSQSSTNTEVAEICKNLNIEITMTEDNSLQELMDDFNSRHKMLTPISSWQVSSFKSEIAEYIGGTVR